MNQFSYYHEAQPQKKVLAIHDVSCVGRCSLTVALPILSACGINTGILPTAILSTHTGEFENFVVHDTSDYLMPIARHLKEAALPFDALYTGYLASSAQVEQILQIFALFPQTFRFVDPAFADHGKLYSMMEMDVVAAFRRLIRHADVLVPNITEALFLLDEDPCRQHFDEAQMLDIARRISNMGPQSVIITGFLYADRMATFLYNKSKNEWKLIQNNVYEGVFHGTGDSFASALLACLLNGAETAEATQIAVEFISRCIEKTLLGKEALRYGVRFEQVLPWLIKKVREGHAKD